MYWLDVNSCYWNRHVYVCDILEGNLSIMVRLGLSWEMYIHTYLCILAMLLWNGVTLTELKNWCQGDRVTRLGEFSPIGRLFTLGSVLKSTEEAQFIWRLFLHQKIRICFDKKWDGLNFGRFFHKHIWSPCRESYFCSYDDSASLCEWLNNVLPFLN
jgi:hypothetical protein